MTDHGDDVEYRGFTLSGVHQTDGWLVTVWPTAVNQPLPENGNVPFQAPTREQAFARARAGVDQLRGGSADTSPA